MDHQIELYWQLHGEALFALPLKQIIIKKYQRLFLNTRMTLATIYVRCHSIQPKVVNFSIWNGEMTGLHSRTLNDANNISILISSLTQSDKTREFIQVELRGCLSKKLRGCLSKKTFEKERYYLCAQCLYSAISTWKSPANKWRLWQKLVIAHKLCWWRQKLEPMEYILESGCSCPCWKMFVLV